MHIKNTITNYGLVSKLFHWISATLLVIQIPLGFYLVDLDFGKERISFENIHIIVGLSIFYLTIFRLLNNIINPPPKITTDLFLGQKYLAKINHLLLYISILSITASGIFKKLLSGETLVIFFKEISMTEDFKLAEQFYDIHTLSSYLIITLISVHVLAVVVHKILFNENLLKKIS
ncbi:cytochrome b/b6 domain-containing protein [Pelagibacteraceae bacterium]|nr:cytochrome b/b6 domain-containing protein [Pelagibacteraceae bacterium]